MKDRIEVLLDLSSCITKLEAVISQLDSFETISNELKKLIADESKWSGETQKKCLQIHRLIVKYEQALRPICEQYKEEISTLIYCAESFETDSTCVNALKGI